MILMMIVLILVMIWILIIVIIMMLVVVVVLLKIMIMMIMIMILVPGVGIKQFNLQWPQAKLPAIMWETTHKATGQRLHISTRKDRHQLMVLYEGGRYIMSQRIDVCGAMAE